MSSSMKTVIGKITSVIIAVAMCTSSFTSAVYATGNDAPKAGGAIQKEIYVSIIGSDQNGDGTAQSPYATVDKARQEVDKINDSMTGDIIVNIGAGDYYLNDTILFNENDSGTNGHEVIYKSCDGIGAANLIGGDKITGFVPTTEDDVNFDLDPSLVGKVYKVQLDKNTYDFNTMYVNDSRATMARTRNRDNNPLFPMAKGEYMRSTGGHNNNLNMNYRASDIDQKSIDGMVNAQTRGEKEIAQVMMWDGGDWDWFTNTIPIETINTANSEFKFPTPPADYPEKYRTKYNIGSGARYFLQGNLAFMDVEGEYHYNKSTGVLYYYPKATDGAMDTQTVIVPTMQKVLYFKGADKANLADVPVPEKQVHNITIDGLGIKDTEFADYFTYSWNWGDGGAGIGHFPKESQGSTNPSYCESVDRQEFRVGSITVTDANNITITNTRVKNAGLYGIIYAGDNQYNKLTNSVIENTGYGGLIFEGGYPAIGKYNNHNTVENVLIHQIGDLVGHAVGFTLMSSGQNTFTNMEIYDTPKRAILVLGGYRRDWNGADKNYDEIKDMYTVGNKFKYVYVHDAQQDAGEDSAVFLSWLLAGRDVNRLHGSKDPNKITTNLEGIDTSIDRYNYFEQTLITDVGADPSVIEKCTSGCLDTAMGVSGTQFKDVRAINGQSHLLAIRTQTEGDGYGDVYGVDNTTHNLYTNDTLRDYDDSRMEYDKIGLRSDFPSEYMVAKREYIKAPDNVYFSDDFEAPIQTEPLDGKKWMVEKGNVEMSLGYGYATENPVGTSTIKRSLPINADLNKDGVVVSHPFDNELNKVVQVAYMDLRKDYAGADAVTSVPTTITPNSFVRVDDGVNALGIGAVGTVSKDYYQIKKGDKLIQTNVKRAFGWHIFKFDYTSGTDVKLYIDDELIATYDDVATSFDYIGMGDWEGKGGKAYFDQLYVYGGKDAPPVTPLPEVYSIPGKLEAENFLNVSGIDVEDCTDTNGGKNITNIQANDWVEYYTKIARDGVYDVNFRAAIPAGKTADFDVMVDGKLLKTVSLASTNGEWADKAVRVSLTSGLHKIKLVAKSGDFKLNWIDFTFVGQEAPCKIEAEDFVSQNNTKTESCDEGGKCLGWLDSSSWMEYKVFVNEPGVYKINYRVAVHSVPSKFSISVNGVEQSTTVIQGTGGWQNWATVTDAVEFEKAGVQTIRINSLTSGWNFNWFELLEGGEIGPKPLPPALPSKLISEDFNGELSIGLSSLNAGVAGREATYNVIDDPDKAGNKVLYVESPDDTVYVKDMLDMSNYIFECKVKVSSNWGGMSELYPWDNMGVGWYLTKDPNKNLFQRYTTKFVREDKTLQLYKRTSADVTMDTKASPAGFEDTWHDYKISALNGVITVSIDGNQIFQYNDATHTKGTIGFDGINAKYYIDDIKVSRPQTEAPSASVESGNFTESFNVKLTSAVPGQVIAYTIDGSDPTTNGIAYDKNKGIDITKTTTLKIAAAGEGMPYSDVVTYTYNFGEVPPEPTDPANKADLEALVSYAKAQRELDEYKFVVPVVKSALDARIASAEAIIADVNATQANVDLAYSSLLDVVQMLSYTGDNTTLLQKYNVWKEFNPAMYTPESAKAMTDALAIVKSVIENPNALQDEIDTALATLETAIKGMELYTANKDALRAQIEKANKYNDNLANYIDNAGKTEFIAALANANDVVAQDYPTQEAIDAACTRLMKATWGLREIPNKDKLQELLTQANALDVTGYTASSVKARAAAISYAQTVMADPMATQEDVNAAITGIKTTTANLVLVEDEKTDDKETTDTTKDETTDKTEDTKVPTTSDTTPLAVVFALAMVSCACVVVRKKVTK